MKLTDVFQLSIGLMEYMDGCLTWPIDRRVLQLKNVTVNDDKLIKQKTSVTSFTKSVPYIRLSTINIDN